MKIDEKHNVLIKYCSKTPVEYVEGSKMVLNNKKETSQ